MSLHSYLVTTATNALYVLHACYWLTKSEALCMHIGPMLIANLFSYGECCLWPLIWSYVLIHITCKLDLVTKMWGEAVTQPSLVLVVKVLTSPVLLITSQYTWPFPNAVCLSEKNWSLLYQAVLWNKKSRTKGQNYLTDTVLVSAFRLDIPIQSICYRSNLNSG